MSDGKVKQLWYLRRNDVVRGPFPAGLISRYVLLGRIKTHDQLSSDGQTWKSITELPSLIPDVMRADLNDPQARQRLLAARRWANERQVADAKALSKSDERRESGKDAAEIIDRHEEHFEHHGLLEEHFAELKRERRKNVLLTLLIVSVVGLVIGLFITEYKAPPKVTIDCAAAPTQGINLSNCFLQGASLVGLNLQQAQLVNANLTAADLHDSDLQGADMSYAVLTMANLQRADLRGANLKGVNLKGALLQQVQLSGADMSYVDLTGARIDQAILDNVMLDHARWIDGRQCAPGSRGHCR